MTRGFATLSSLITIVAVASIATSVAAAPPEEGDCPSVTADPSNSGSGAADAAPILLEEGMIIDYASLLALRKVLPAEIWQHREVFFHEGMRLEVGPCHRRYRESISFTAATQRFSGQTHLDGKGNLILNRPGLPFPPDKIDLEAEDAGIKWAWNLQRRYRGAGLRGSFRITDLPGRVGGIQVYEGEFFVLPLQNRSDLGGSNYEEETAEGRLWVAGGRFTEPFNARHLAWRQFRPEDSIDSWEAADDVFLYVPEMRKMRRAASIWSDGLFFPRYSVSMGGSGGGMAFGSGGGINPTAGQSISVTQDARTGLTGLALRPNAYIWRVKGEQDLLAPINSARPGYPSNPNRNFGPSGLSLASDRWDVRRAVVIEGAARQVEETLRTITIYVDYQTQVPLYWISRTDQRRIMEIGVLAHRYSGDLAGYGALADGEPMNVFDPVAAAFLNALEGAGGWRRESYDAVATPADREERRAMNSIEILQRGR